MKFLFFHSHTSLAHRALPKWLYLGPGESILFGVYSMSISLKASHFIMPNSYSKYTRTFFHWRQNSFLMQVSHSVFLQNHIKKSIFSIDVSHLQSKYFSPIDLFTNNICPSKCDSMDGIRNDMDSRNNSNWDNNNMVCTDSNRIHRMRQQQDPFHLRVHQACF